MVLEGGGSDICEIRTIQTLIPAHKCSAAPAHKEVFLRLMTTLVEGLL